MLHLNDSKPRGDVLTVLRGCQETGYVREKAASLPPCIYWLCSTTMVWLGSLIIIKNTFMNKPKMWK